MHDLQVKSCRATIFNLWLKSANRVVPFAKAQNAPGHKTERQPAICHGMYVLHSCRRVQQVAELFASIFRACQEPLFAFSS